MKIVFYLAAKKQLTEIHDFIALESPAGAVKMYNGILDEIERLIIFPQIAKVEEELKGIGVEFRSLVVFRRYKVVFFKDCDTVFVVSVWDCRRNPEEFAEIIKAIIK